MHPDARPREQRGSANGVISQTQPSGERPPVTYRQAGDHHVLIEYGQQELDLRLNFFVVAVLDELTTAPPAGFVEAVPGLRSILIRFDPHTIARSQLIAWLHAIHAQQPETASLTIPSRLITLPIAFNDTASAEAVQRYATTIRHDAPNTRDGSNIDYIVECNGLAGREALYETVTGVQWWAAFTGFSPGLPFLFPLDPRQQLRVPKYNPTRSWTPEGAVGMGGPCVAIYPVDSPGSYQLFGRTVPIADLLGRHSAFTSDPFLIKPGDRVRFERVNEAELNRARAAAFDDRYEYRIEDSPFAVASYTAAFDRPHAGRRGSGRRPFWVDMEVP